MSGVYNIDVRMLLVAVIQDEKTPLHHAAEDGYVDTVRLFLRDYHADTTITSTVSETES